MIGNLRCCNNIHWGDKDLCHCSMDVSRLHDTVPSKIKSNLNCRCQLTCDDWGIPNTKLKYYQCTSAALLCCKNKQLFNCIWPIITHEWWIWIVLFIPRCYQTSFWSGDWFCAFEILVALATKTDLGAVFTQGVWGWGWFFEPMKIRSCEISFMEVIECRKTLRFHKQLLYYFLIIFQGWFLAGAQTMRDVVTK